MPSTTPVGTTSSDSSWQAKPLVRLDAESLSSEPRVSRSKPIPVASYVFGGAAVVGLGMFTYFGLSELSDLKEKERLDEANARARDSGQPEQACGSLCERGRRDFVLTYVGLGVAVAGVTGAVLAYVLSEPEPNARSAGLRLELTPLAAGSGGLARLSGAF